MPSCRVWEAADKLAAHLLRRGASTARTQGEAAQGHAGALQVHGSVTECRRVWKAIHPRTVVGECKQGCTPAALCMGGGPTWMLSSSSPAASSACCARASVESCFSSSCSRFEGQAWAWETGRHASSTASRALRSCTGAAVHSWRARGWGTAGGNSHSRQRARRTCCACAASSMLPRRPCSSASHGGGAPAVTGFATSAWAPPMLCRRRHRKLAACMQLAVCTQRAVGCRLRLAASCPGSGAPEAARACTRSLATKFETFRAPAPPSPACSCCDRFKLQQVGLAGTGARGKGGWGWGCRR